MPDTLAQALYRYLAGQVAVYLPAPFDPSALETNVATALDTVNSLVPHIDALEQRDAVHTQALADLKAQVAALQAASASAAPELVAAVDAIAARLDKVDQDAPPVTPAPPVTDVSGGGGVTTEPSTG